MFRVFRTNHAWLPGSNEMRHMTETSIGSERPSKLCKNRSISFKRTMGSLLLCLRLQKSGPFLRNVEISKPV